MIKNQFQHSRVSFPSVQCQYQESTETNTSGWSKRKEEARMFTSACTPDWAKACEVSCLKLGGNRSMVSYSQVSILNGIVDLVPMFACSTIHHLLSVLSRPSVLHLYQRFSSQWVPSVKHLLAMAARSHAFTATLSPCF